MTCCGDCADCVETMRRQMADLIIAHHAHLSPAIGQEERLVLAQLENACDPQAQQFMEQMVKTLHAAFTQYFQAMRQRPDRAMIQLEWIQRVVEQPVKEVIQQDGRIRRWAPIKEMEGRYLRVILLPDGETVHNAFFDRSFTP